MSILGYLTFKGKTISFNLEDFYVKVMQGNGVIIPEKLDIDKFIYGITDNGHSIAFQTGMSAYNHMQFTEFPISYYIVDEGNAIRTKFDSFEKIQFCGGSLNYLIPTQAVYDGTEMWKNFTKNENNNEENYKIELLSLYKTSHETNITIFGKRATYSQYPCYLHNMGKNIALKIFNVIEFVFEEAQPIELIQQCYAFAFDYISFLIGHKDIGFDNIYISKMNEYSDPKIPRTAEVFVNTKQNGDGTATANKTIQLKWFDSYIQNFIIIYEKDDLYLEFLPDNEDAGNYVNINLVKQLCTALEIEYTLDTGKKPYDETIKELSKKVIHEVNIFKKENSMLSKKFYDSIMTSIGYWSLPLAEKITYLYVANKNIMDSYIKNKGWNDCHIDDASIGNFVKARNNSTHGNKKRTEKENARFIYLMKVMTYALIMKRLGFEEENIVNILNRIF